MILIYLLLENKRCINIFRVTVSSLRAVVDSQRLIVGSFFLKVQITAIPILIFLLRNLITSALLKSKQIDAKPWERYEKLLFLMRDMKMNHIIHIWWVPIVLLILKQSKSLKVFAKTSCLFFFNQWWHLQLFKYFCFMKIPNDEKIMGYIRWQLFFSHVRTYNRYT